MGDRMGCLVGAHTPAARAVPCRRSAATSNELSAPGLRLRGHVAFNPVDVVADPNVTTRLTIESQAQCSDITLGSCPRRKSGQQPLVFDLNECWPAAVSVTGHSLKG